jgi:hypothetical protein
LTLEFKYWNFRSPCCAVMNASNLQL